MKLGQIIEVKADPATNDGLETAAAMVTGVYEDGSARVRVFGAAGTEDTVRNHVGEDGEPYVYDDPNADVSPAADEATQQAETAYSALSDDDRAAFDAWRAGQSSSTPPAPTTQGTPGAGI
jgi:hypothetical protein